MKFKTLFFLIPIWLSFLFPLTAEEPRLLEHEAPVSALAFSPVDASLIAIAGVDTDIKVWDAHNDTLRTLKGHQDTVTSLAFSPDGSLLASTGGGQTILWQMPDLRKITTFGHGGPEIAFSADATLLAIAGRHVNVFDVARRTEIATLEHDEWVWSLSFSNDGRFLAADAGTGTAVTVWDLQQKQIVSRLQGHTADINFVHFSPVDGLLASSSWAGEIMLWNVDNWTRLGALPHNATAVVNFSPDGKILASGGIDTVTLWSTQNGEHLATLQGHQGWVREIAFSPDGTELVSGGEGGRIHIHNIANAMLAQEQQGIVRIIYFLPSDRTPQRHIAAKLDQLIKDVQQVYAQQMEHKGFGKKTFTFETDADGRAVVHYMKGKLKDADYHNPSGKVWKEIGERFDLSRNIYLAALDISTEILDGFASGYGGPRGAFGGTVLIPASGGSFNIDVTTHELGHAFGLAHDFRSNATAKRTLLYTSEPMSTSLCAAEWLDVHPYFNPATPPAFDAPATVEMLPPRAAPENAIRFRFKVTDTDGLHQVQFLTPEIDYAGSLLASQRLDGDISHTVEFLTTELTPKNTSVYLKVMDVKGNYRASQQFPIDITRVLPHPKVVSLPDTNLAAAVRETLKLAPDTPLTTHTLLNLIRLNAPHPEITDLTGLEHARNLKALNLGRQTWNNSNNISNLAPLKGLTHLITLDLSGNAVSDVTPLAGLKNLTSLNLWNNPVSDVTPLAGLKELRYLNISNNAVSNITPLAELTHLNTLHLSENAISNVSALAGLKHLNTLNLLNTNASDITPLAGLKRLNALYLSNNGLSDVEPLANLTHLTVLHLEHNAISDMAPLTSLGEQALIYLRGNPVFGTPGPKIEGPWLWMMVPIGGDGAAPAAASGIDYLYQATSGTVSEQQIATHGATPGDVIGDKAWTPGKIAPTGDNNITDLMNAIGLGNGDIENHVAYGSITLESPRKQNTRMYVGSNDAVKVWINGVLVHNAPVVRSAGDYQNFFPVTLKHGKNILCVAVYQSRGEWSGFFGFQHQTQITPIHLIQKRGSLIH